jgi:hypothetical protein
MAERLMPAPLSSVRTMIEMSLSHSFEAYYLDTSSGPKSNSSRRAMEIFSVYLLHGEVLPRSFKSIQIYNTAESYC